MSDVEDDAPEVADDAAVAAMFVDLGAIFHQSRWAVDVDYWGYRLQVDPTFAVEMRLCKEWGIPHSAFLEWDEDDRAKAIAHHLHEARRCGSCGIHPAEWDREEYPPPFETDFLICPGCEEMDKARRHLQERGKNLASINDGVKPYLRRVR